MTSCTPSRRYVHHGRITCTTILLLFLAVLVAPALVSASVQLQGDYCYSTSVLPMMYKFYDTSGGYIAVSAVPNDPAAASTHVEMYSNESGIGSPLASSTIDGELNFLVRNHAPTGDWNYAQVSNNPLGNAVHTALYTPGNGFASLPLDQTVHHGGIVAGCGVLQVWTVTLSAFTQYEVRANQQTGGDDVRVAILRAGNNTDWIARGNAETEVIASSWGADNPVLYTPTVSGSYAVVIFSNKITTTGDMRVRMQAAPPSLQPDLLISSIAPSLVTAGQAFTATISVHNAGGGDAPSSYTSVSIDGSTQCAQVATPAVASGQTVSVLCSMPAQTAGSHTLSACADAPGLGSIVESDENDNCSTSPLTVSSPSYPKPDLHILLMGPDTAFPGGNTNVWAWVENIGGAIAPASETAFIIDGVVYNVATPSIAPGNWASVQTSVSLLRGYHNVEACADTSQVMTEVYENNNCSSIWISAAAPDLEIVSISPAEGRDDTGTSVSITVSNTGNDTAPSSTTRVTLDGATLCDVATPSISAGGQTVVQCTVPTQAAGTYTLAGSADQPNGIGEIYETNNDLSISFLVRPAKVNVYSDGSGDYPTIQAAVDAVVSGGVVTLYSGTYSGTGNRDVTYRGKAVTVVVKSGGTVVIDCSGASSGFIFNSGETSASILDGVTITNLSAGFGSAVRVWNSAPVIQNCVFTGVSADSGAAMSVGGTLAKTPQLIGSTIAGNTGTGAMIHVDGPSTLVLQNTLVASNKNAPAALCTGGGNLSLACSDVWGNGSDYTGCLAGQNGINGNLSSDPLFCTEVVGGFYVSGDSPCTAANSGACGTIGTNDEGCSRAADTFLVKADGSGDYITIQQALNAAVDGDRILLAPGTFWTPGNFDLSFLGKRVTLEAQNGAPGVVIDADSAWGAGYNGMSIVGSPDSVIVRNITIRDATHGAVIGNTKVYFEGVIFTNCCGSENGAGAKVDGSGGPTHVRFVNCYFIGNSVTGTGAAGSEGWGGGLWATNASDVILDGCWIQSNSASQNGGGVFVGGAAADYSTGLLTNCQLTSNSAGHNAGGAYAASNVTLDVVNCSFGNNTATDAAGALGYAGTCTGLVSQTMFQWNSAGSNGGAIMTHGWCTPTIEYCTFYQNAAPAGTVYPRHFSNVTLRNSIVVEATSGPAVDCVSSSTLTLSFNDFWNNAGGDYIGCAAGQLGVNGNISADPLFCQSGSDFRLHEFSPAAGMQPSERMGARAVGCFAQILSVQADRLGEYQDIQTAIDNARAFGDTVELGDGTYTGLGNHDIDFNGKAVVVRSQSGDAAACIVDCQGSVSNPYRGFKFNSGETSASILQDITVVNGYLGGGSGAGVYVLNASPTLRRCVFRNGYAANGGGVYVQGAAATIEDCTFDANSTNNSGGGLGLNGSGSTVTRCTFTNNATTYGGGGIYANNSPATISECLFTGNTATSWGGGFHARLAGSTATLTDCTFDGNGAPQGGAVFVRNSAVPTLTRCILTGSTNGGGVYCADASSVPLISCTDIWGNTGGDWNGFIAGQAGTAGNISAAPLYCDAAAGTYGLFASSPCAADSSCGVMGAKPVSCGRTVLVRADGTGDYPTIQTAISAVADADTVDLADGVYTGSGNRDVSFLGKAIIVRSQSGNPAACVVDCQATSVDPHKGFRFTSGEDTTSVLQNLTVRGAYSVYGGAMLCSGASPKISGCVFEGNHGYDGGGMHIFQANPVVEDCRFVGNTASDAGGAVSLNTSTAQLRRCTFDGNVADYGGGGVFMYSASPIILQGLFANNSAYVWGGAVHAKQSSAPFIASCTIYGSNSVSGGGVFSELGSTPVLARVIIASGAAGAGAVAADGASVPTFSCSDIWGNPGGDWTGYIAGQAGSSGNVSSDPAFCSAASGNFSLGAASPCLASNNSCGVVIGYTGAVCTPTAVGGETPAPQRTALLFNYPNPFNPTTVIPYELASPARVRLTVYDVAGRLVATLVDRDEPAGRFRATWDGRTRSGHAASGVYFYRLEAGRVVQTRKMVLLK